MAKRTVAQPVTKKQENAADALMAALANIGQVQKIKDEPIKKSNRTGPREPNRRSRFFFVPTLSFTEDVEERKKVSLPKEVEIVDEHVTRRVKTYEKEFPPKLNKNIETVREFWLKKIAPVALAAQSGSEQARDVIQRTLGVEIDATSFMQFQLMLQKGTTLKLADYVAEYLELRPEDRSEILDVVKIHRPQKEVVYVSDGQARGSRGQNNNLTSKETKESDDE